MNTSLAPTTPHVGRNGAELAGALAPSPESRLVPSPSRPSIRMMEDRAKVRLLTWLVVGVAALGFISIVLVVWKMKEPQMVSVVDAAGVIHSGPLMSLSAGDGLFRHIAMLATVAMLSRTTGEGGRVALDWPEYLEPLFEKEAQDQVNKDLTEQTPEFVSRRLSQKPQVESITIVSQKGDIRYVASKGSLERTGVFQGRAYREHLPFSLVVALRPNPRMDVAGAFPFVVASVSVRLRDDRAQTSTSNP